MPGLLSVSFDIIVDVRRDYVSRLDEIEREVSLGGQLLEKMKLVRNLCSHARPLATHLIYCTAKLRKVVPT
jgi:abortive infection bacteriophage resistance protein